MTVWRIRRWTDADLPILVGSNTPEMTVFVGGPETEAQVRRRHERYLRGWDVGRPRMFAIVAPDGTGVGGIGWWDSEWEGRPVLETGWSVLPEFQRRGAARAALALVVEDARVHGGRDLLTAFPGVDNIASNALCRGAGFVHRGTVHDHVRGSALELNAWVLRLR